MLGAAMLFGPIWLLNGMATAIRIALAIADLLRDIDRGYLDPPAHAPAPSAASERSPG